MNNDNNNSNNNTTEINDVYMYESPSNKKKEKEKENEILINENNENIYNNNNKKKTCSNKFQKYNKETISSTNLFTQERIDNINQVNQAKLKFIEQNKLDSIIINTNLFKDNFNECFQLQPNSSGKNFIKNQNQNQLNLYPIDLTNEEKSKKKI